MKKLSGFGKYLALRSRYGSVVLETIDKDQVIEIVEEVKDLSYYKANAEEDYLKVPISVLRYISELEKQQERSYSEEDLRKAWEDGRNNVKTVGTPPFVITKFQYSSFTKWFKQFKKK